MTNADWNRTKQVFEEALDRAGHDRERFLREACHDDAELRSEVERLLTAHDAAGDFLNLLTVGSAADGPQEQPGDRIGPYKLLQLIGEGGFGVVYMAEQDEPIHRRVALKIIKPGMDTKEVIARFESERQALALMDHPNIAKILDAGATDTGRPFFVMELVKGVPLTAYCDANHLSMRDRLQLFIPIAQAVHHAHERGIIHRDIKPSNVMVTLHDAKPVPKIIDFGVAKAISQRLTEKTLFTAYGSCVGTPSYMSPEQAEMSGLEIDRRSDIYSLGVLLYELLTGTTPLPEEKLRSAAFVELLRIIREHEPPTPSARLNTLGGDLEDIARNRHAEPHALTRSVRGDLDWIVMKAIEKDRRRRYDSAEALAEDLTRYFSSQPVKARRPSMMYRAGKFARRRRAPLGAAAGIVGALMLGGILAQFGGLNPGAGDLLAQEYGTDNTRGFVARRVFSYPVLWPQAYGAACPKGQYVTTFDWGHFAVELSDVTTGDARPLTETLPDFAYSVFSPDCSAVAFNDLGNVYVTPIDGSSEQLLYDSPFSAAEYTRTYVNDWSDDGSWLLAIVWPNDETNRLARISYPDGTAEFVGDIDGGLIESADISPDGRYIAYAYDSDPERAGGMDIVVMDADGDRATTLVGGAPSDYGPVWMPDGRSILFLSTRGGSNDFWVVPVDDGRAAGAPRLVKTESGNIAPLGFTDDGDFFYHVSKSTSEVRFAQLDPVSRTLTEIGLPGVETYGNIQTNPVWSPDGSKLAYRNGQTLIVRDSQTGTEQNLAIDRLVRFVIHDWSEDGTRLLISGRTAEGAHDIVWIDTTSDERELVFSNPLLLRDVKLSPDQATAYYSTPSNHLEARDLATGKARTILESDKEFMRGGILPSPDGSRLLVGIVEETPQEGYQGALMVVDLATGETVRLARPQGERRAFSWTQDGENVLAIYDDAWLISPESGEPQRVGQYLNGLTFLTGQARGGIDFRPDSGTLAYVHGGQSNEIWVLEDLQNTLNSAPYD